MAMESLMTTGRFSMAPRPRMHTFGWLITGRPNSPPKTPGLVMEKVPSCTSSGFIFLVRVLDDRDDQAPLERHGDAHIDFLVEHHVGAVERSIQRGISTQARHGRLHEE